MRYSIGLLLLAIFSSHFSCEPEGQGKQSIFINARKQNIVEWGRGKPTVVFITGLGDDLGIFDSVQREISKLTRTVSYDRAGLGESEPYDQPRTVDNMVRELDAILQQKKLDNNLVLIGHSLGGHIARYYANTYPSKIKGVILIDPAHERFMDEVRKVREDWESAQLDSVRNSYYSRTTGGVQAEFSSVKESEAMMAGIGLPKNIPSTVITSSKYLGEAVEWPFTENDKKKWVQLHKELVTTSNHAKHVITDKSGHYVHVEDPQLVIKEIKSLLKKL